MHCIIIYILSESADADNILFLKYEDMKKDLHQAIKTVSSFIGYKFEPQVVDSIVEQCSFQFMKETYSSKFLEWTSAVGGVTGESDWSFCRKGQAGDWKNYFTEDQNRRFNEEYAKRMSGSGLDFEFV